MIYLSLLVLILSVFEVWGMVKKHMKKEIIVFAIIAVLALGLGIFNISDPYRESLAQQVLRIIGKQF